jgi:hypothetical protein
MKSLSGELESEMPLDVSVEREDAKRVLTLKLLGRYEAVLRRTKFNNEMGRLEIAAG